MNGNAASSPGGRIVPADTEGLRRAADLLRAESVCAFPTETVYGLGASAYSAKAVAQVYRMKGRPAWNPLIVHAASLDAAREMARDWPPSASALAERYWPGPLTLVVEQARDLPVTGSSRTGTVAVRVPAHPVALALLEACGLPLAAPSANRSEGISPTTADHVIRSLPDVPLVLDGGRCRFGIESTVVDVTSDRITLLRPGALSVRAIRDVVGDLRVAGDSAAGDHARSPGTGRKHYAPRARVMIVDVIAESRLLELPAPVGVITHEGPLALSAAAAAHVELLPPVPEYYAADLYAALHRLDDAGVTTIVVQATPENDEWLAIRDRLTRAAGADSPVAAGRQAAG